MKIQSHFRIVCSGILSLSVFGLCSCTSGPQPVTMESAYNYHAMNRITNSQKINSEINSSMNEISQNAIDSSLNIITSGGDTQLAINDNPYFENEELINSVQNPKPVIQKTSSEIELIPGSQGFEESQELNSRSSEPIFKTVTNSAVPRKPLKTDTVSHSHNQFAETETNWEDYRDEHLLDGGDRAHPIHLDDYGYAGLETEDTFAEYSDHTGDKHIKPTNEVMIYSPRFGSVRAIHKPLAGVEIAKLSANYRAERTGGMRKRIATAHHGQRVGTDRIRVRSRLSGLDTDSGHSGLSERTVISEHNKITNTYIDKVTTFFGGFNQLDKAEIAAGIQAAITWTRDENPIITASTAAAMDIKASFIASEIVGLDDQKTKGHLKIIKMANKKTAVRGDIVKFTIHFTNLGDRELKNIRIIDNLTPRLEYISESASSELEGRLDVYDNAEGSLVLTFEISEELKGHESATVTFDCKVK